MLDNGDERLLISCRRTVVAFSALAALVLAPAASSPARADLLSDAGAIDAANFQVLYEGNGGNQLHINNGPGPSGLAVSGNIGIGGTGKLSVSGPLTIDGNIEFASTPNRATNPAGGNIVINGTYTGNNANVTTDLTSLNNFSAAAGAAIGTPLRVDLNNRQSQTVNVSAGTTSMVNGHDEQVFTVTSFKFTNGATLTINGDGSQNVIIDFAANAHFGGAIQLTGGITSDQVLFNFTGGNDTTRSGGPTLQINTNGETETGIFLNPNGAMSINHSVLKGRLFGGGTSNMSIVSGGLVADPPVPLPEPSSLVIAGFGALGFLGYGLRRRRPA